MPSGGTFGEYMTFRPDQLAELLRGPDGAVGRDLLRRGEIVKEGAKRRVGVYVPPPEGPKRARRSGTLRDSIVKRLANVDGELNCLVGSNDPIALLHHEGTVPHVITPKKAGGRLAFYLPAAGRVISTPKVNHPGTQPNRYLTDALADLN